MRRVLIAVLVICSTQVVDASLSEFFHSGPTQKLRTAARDGDSKAILTILRGKDKGDCNGKEKGTGETPMMKAAANGHVACLTPLIANGAVMCREGKPITDDNSNTPLIHAVQGCQDGWLSDCAQIKVVSKLLDSFGNDETDWVNWNGKNGQTALMMAVRKKQKVMVELLLQSNKVNFEVKDNDGKTVLMHAAEEGHENMLKLLLTTKAAGTINMKDGAGVTALDIAISFSRSECEALLRAVKGEL
jgi:ankyrin repeat protein